jgi:hypothetical protein
MFVGVSNIMEAIPDKEFKPAVKDMVKAVAPLYIPATLMCGAAVACFIGANTISAKRLTATSAALTATEEAFRTYKNKVVEQIGETKAKEVIEKIVQDKVEQDPPRFEKSTDEDGKPVESNVVITGDGETLFKDLWTNRYFKSDIDKVKRVINKLNARLLHEDYISLNELYDELGLDRAECGNDWGWHVMDEGLIDVEYTSVMAYADKDMETPIPCIGIGFRIPPRYKYSNSRW